MPTDELNIAIVIAKNTTGSPIFLDDLGLQVDASGQRTLSDQFHLDEITASEDLKTQVQSGNIVINDGTTDLDSATGFDYITTNTLSRDPNDPIWNAGFIYNFPVTDNVPDNGDVLVYNSGSGGYEHVYFKEPDAGPMVLPLVWAETDASKKDWLDMSPSTDAEIGHLLAFPIRIRDAAMWCKQCTPNTQTLKLYIEDTIILDPLFTIPNSGNPQKFTLTGLDILVNAGDRMRIRTGDVNSSIKRIVVNLTVERIG